MNTKRINGRMFEGMLANGLANLRRDESRVNDLNVFPVADGDTGTNMCCTLERGLHSAGHTPVLSAYLQALSEGMLLGARGNSGVILSQLFRGIFLELSHCAAASPDELCAALIRGYKTAYTAVVCPAEGTVLTVAREGIEHIKAQVGSSTTIETLLSMYLAEMRKSLIYTPEMLPVLKENGVVDSGAMGYILIIEGMLKYLYGEMIALSGRSQTVSNAPDETSLALFNENSEMKIGYCMEFVLQLLSGSSYNPHFQMNDYVEALSAYGSSLMVTAADNRRIKIHIHTMTPAKVISASQEYGEFVSFKLENMQIQHNEYIQNHSKSSVHKPLSTVVAVNGQGLKTLFSELGCDCVIDGGFAMNVSSEEFLGAYRRVNADEIVVMPNNANALLAAQQAAELYGNEHITILPTTGMMECYYAMSMDIPDSTDTQYRISQMNIGRESVVSFGVTMASKAYAHGGLRCSAGDYIATCNGSLTAASLDIATALKNALEAHAGISSLECGVVFRGEGADESDEEMLRSVISDFCPDIELCFINGGQHVYQWLIGLA